MIEYFFQPVYTLLRLLGANWTIHTSKSSSSSNLVAWESTQSFRVEDLSKSTQRPSLSTSLSSNASYSSIASTATCSSSFFGGNRLFFEDFVANSTPQATLAWCEDLAVDGRRGKVRSITFEDTVIGSTYRRWLFKKTGVYRRILDVAKDLHIPVYFEATVEIDCDQMTPKSILSLLDAIKTDPDVKSVVFSGSMHYSIVLEIAKAVTDLLTHDDRHWKQVHLGIHFDAPTPKDAQLAQRVFQRALKKIASERYITLQVC
ncbi:expressed unknown protein [Seminavis robusta]|uniref:Uncharacterized protein n=1 Tax=Seminavis robusta TaxID=568900 RepID=A0A9N8DG12_9STRA|nr:expressed unknown protein [Seminavis robusta]|eukprot:Sro140_g065370.1 n/a (260) ;mRNA; r:20919-21698